MKDVIFGAVLFGLTALLFLAVIREWGTWLTLLLGGAFVVAAASWLLFSGGRRNR